MLTAIVMLTLSAPADPPKLSEDAQKELKKLEGKWKAVKVVANGTEEVPTMDGNDVLIEFKGRKLLMGDKEFLEVVELDPTTDPKLLDVKALQEKGGVRKDMVFEAIYKLDGDTLTLALHMGETKKRPDKFESAKDSGIVIVTLKREKP